MRINIIGAGPAGSYSAYLLAKRGYDVNVFERKSVIGEPVQCTGILSDHFTTIMQPKDEFLENTVTKARIFAPNGNYAEAKIKKNYVICRKKFDNYLADLAKSEGAKLHMNHSFSSLETQGNMVKIKINHKGNAVFSESDKLIGADGPLSSVAKAAGLYKNRVNLIGTQIEAKMLNENVVEFFPYIGCYAWIVPKNEETVRIGVVSYKDSAGLFKRFAKEKLGEDYEKKILEHQSGVIPLFNPKVKTQKKNIYLNGDAATFVKATTGGGINQGLMGAQILSDSIAKSKNFDFAWRQKMFNNLFFHLLAHKTMTRFRDSDWNSLVDTFSEGKMRSILYNESRDRIVSMLIRTIAAKPTLLKYMKYFPYSELKNVI
jgi:digeranylgeranylglycerophospholipid reductase